MLILMRNLYKIKFTWHYKDSHDYNRNQTIIAENAGEIGDVVAKIDSKNNVQSNMPTDNQEEKQVAVRG
jgi:hypothetical protein